MKIQVECYCGYWGDETPRRLSFGVREIEVAEVIERWVVPDHRYFKVLGDDSSTYILRHDMTSLDWELILFEEKKQYPP